MDVQGRELAGLEALGRGGLGKPVLPVRRNVVVADVGRIPEKEGGTVDSGKLDGTIVGDKQGQPVGHAERGQWVDLDGDQIGIRKRLSSRPEEAARSRARVDDAFRDVFASRPSHHGFDDRPRSVDCSLFAAGFRGAQFAEGATERIVTAHDGTADRLHVFRGRNRAVAHHRALGTTKGHVRAHQGHGKRRELVLGRGKGLRPFPGRDFLRWCHGLCPGARFPGPPPTGAAAGSRR